MNRTKYLTIALLSLSLLALELVWTRIFSAEFFYTFAFLILSLAIMGLGLGGLAIRLFPAIERRIGLGLLLTITALLALAGPPLVFRIGLKFTDLFHSWAMVGKLALTVLLLSSTYLAGGMALALLFKRHHQDMPRLYMADLLGAGSGVILAVLLMNQFGTPAAAFLIALPVLLAALLESKGALKALPLLLTAALVVLTVKSDPLLQPEKPDRAPVIYSHWDAQSKIKIYDFGEDYRSLNIDNVANSPVLRFDGRWVRPDSEKIEFGIPVDWLIKKFDDCSFLSLGAGGGSDVLQALQAGATDVHAVEVIDHINNLMLEGELAEFSGRIYRDPRVTVATEDARAYVRRHPGRFDIIYSLSSNTFAALASGSFTMAESYLFTTEAFRDYWNALSDNGFMMLEHQFYMPRLVSEVIDALTGLGIADPTAHFAVYDLPQLHRNALLLSRQPLTSEIRSRALMELTPDNYSYIHLLYPAPDSTSGNLINRIVLDGWQAAADSANIDLSPATDNRPFVAQMGLWKNLNIQALERVLPYEFYGFPLSKLLILIILAVVIVLVLPLNFLPRFIGRATLKSRPVVYFFLIGAAFMMVEVILIQKYTLFIGPSVYSLITILLALLVGSGIGSRRADHYRHWTPFIGIAVWIALDLLLLGRVTAVLAPWPLLPRLLVAAILILPLGYFMGMPFPKGAGRVGELIDWCFSINGAAGVIGSVGILLVAFAWGYAAALTLAALLYLLAGALLANPESW
ncbi:MAG: hypothetical protein ABIA75_11750 [Candidatus Neomarinimicrobiota bacterium]